MLHGKTRTGSYLHAAQLTAFVRVAAVSIAASSATARTGPTTPSEELITNGDFDNGLFAWDTQGDVSVVSGMALLNEPANGLVSELSQEFMLGGEILSISFDLVFESVPGGTGGSALADSFFASVLDAGTLEPILRSPGSDDFYFLDADGTQVLGPGVSFDQGRVTLDFADGNGTGAGTDVLLQFRFAGFADGNSTSVGIDNVSALAVPAPSAALVLATACGAMTTRRRTRHA